MGSTIDAGRAHALGLVNRVVPAAGVVPTALELAALIAANAPLAVRATRAMVQEAVDLPRTTRGPATTSSSARCSPIPTPMEGATAFAEKRPPVWTSSD